MRQGVEAGARPCQGRGRGFESLRPLQDLADFTTVGTWSRGNAWGNSSYCKCPFGRWSRALLTSRTINRSTYFATDLRSAGHKRAVPIHHRPRVGESVRFLRSDSNRTENAVHRHGRKQLPSEVLSGFGFSITCTSLVFMICSSVK